VWEKLCSFLPWPVFSSNTEWLRRNQYTRVTRYSGHTQRPRRTSGYRKYLCVFLLCSRVLYEKLGWSRNSLSFMEPEGSLACTQEPELKNMCRTQNVYLVTSFTFCRFSSMVKQTYTSSEIGSNQPLNRIQVEISILHIPWFVIVLWLFRDICWRKQEMFRRNESSLKWIFFSFCNFYLTLFLLYCVLTNCSE
jgi:hypothetical protein